MKEIKMRRLISFVLTTTMIFGLFAGIPVSANDYISTESTANDFPAATSYMPIAQAEQFNSNEDGADTYNGHTYKIFDVGMTWQEAELYCNSLDGHLMTITSQGEHDFIVNLIKSKGGDKSLYWLGATDEETEGKWKWVTGETWDYTNWDSYNPDNYTDGDGNSEDYLGLWKATGYEWNDFRYYGGFGADYYVDYGGFICEWDSVIPDEPDPLQNYIVTFSAKDGIGGAVKAIVDGTNIVSGSSVYAGKNISFAAIPNAGYRVKKWTIDYGILSELTSPNNPRFNIKGIKTNATIVVEFEAVPDPIYRITTSVNNSDYGTADALPTEAVQGVVINLTAAANAGYAFDYWEVLSGSVTINDINSRETSFTMPDADVSVKANFKQAVIPVRFDENIEATVDGVSIASGDYVMYGKDVKFTAKLESGYSVKEWVVYNGTGYTSYEEITELLIEKISVPINVTLKMERTAIDITDDFKDANFLAAILELLGKQTGDRIYDIDVKDIAEVDVSSKNIADLSGIEHFTALTWLFCYSNELTELDVSNNTALTRLNCGYNELTALDVSNNTALTTLYCYSNELTALDVSNNTALTWLNCDGNQLTALDVSNNTSLTWLDCNGNQLTALDVSNNTALTTLYCEYNQLTALDVSNNTALTTLYCYSNQLTVLDVSNNTALTTLLCESNQLTALDVSNNTALTTLYCEYNQLTELDVSNNTALTYLDCYSNQLTELDVSNNTALTWLGCYDNELTSLDVSNNTALTYLDCRYNNMKSTDDVIGWQSIGLVLDSTFLYNPQNYLGPVEYIVTYSVIDGNGTLSAVAGSETVASGDKVVDGTEVIFTAVPNSGYSVKEWKVNGAAIASNKTNTLSLNINTDTNVTVEFEQKPGYIITFSGIGEGVVTSTVDGVGIESGTRVEAGKTVNFKAVPSPGYRVKEWRIDDGMEMVLVSQATFTARNIASDITVEVEFEAIIYNVTTSVNDDDYGTASANPTSGIIGTTISLTAEAKDGYAFDFWEVLSGGVSVSNVRSASASFDIYTSNVSIRANFRRAVYDVTTSVNNEDYGTASASPASAEKDTTISLTAEAKVGYVFDYWHVLSGGAVLEELYSPATTFVMPESDVSVRANFKQASYPVNFNIVGGIGGSLEAIVDARAIASGDYVLHGKEVVFTAVPDTGYRVKEWSIDSSSIGSDPDIDDIFTILSLTEPITVTVEFEQVAYIVNFNIIGSTGGGNLTAFANETEITSGSYVTHGNKVEFRAIPNAGYRVKEWGIDYTSGIIGDPVGTVDTFTIPKLTRSITITVEFEETTETVYNTTVGMNGAGYGKASAIPEAASKDTTISLTAEANEGYAFKSWEILSGNIDIKDANALMTSFTMPDSDVEIQANFELLTYEVKYDVNGGTGAPAGQIKTHGVTLTLSSAVPTRTGYTFLGWSKFSTASTATYEAGGSYTENAEATLYAVWQIESQDKDNTIIFGKDNWKFAQASSIFSLDYWMTDNFYSSLTSKLSNTERTRAQQMRNSSWGGSCYGMAVTEILAKTNIFRVPEWESGKTNLSDLTKTRKDNNESLINYYQILQINTKIQQKITNTIYYQTEAQKVKELIDLSSEVKNGGNPVLFCYFFARGGGHAVVAYGVEYGSWTWNGVAYGGRILISDPNYADFADSSCLYFNTSTYAWTIPYFSLRSAGGDYIGLVTNDLSLINHFGYFSGDTIGGSVMDYIAVLELASNSLNYSVQKIRQSINGGWINSPTYEDEIKPFYDMRNDDDSQNIKYALKDSQSGYQIHLETPEKLDLSMTYEQSLLTANADKGKSVKFQPNGFIELESVDSDFEMSMTFNEGHYTLPWYMVSAKGRYANNVSMTKVDDGIVLCGDNLTDVTVSASNLSSSVDVKFTAIYESKFYDSVLIYDIDENTIGISVDADGDGVYETLIAEERNGSGTDILYGDVNGDGDVDMADLIRLARHLAEIELITDPALLAAGDVNGDGDIDMADLIRLARYLAEIDVSPLGT